MINKEERDDILHYAKLPPENMCNKVQLLTFSSDFDTDLRFFQLNEHIQNEMKPESTFILKPSREGTAVLCTDIHNYDIKLAETDNTLIYVDKLNIENDSDEFQCVKAKVKGICSKLYELRPRRACPGDIYRPLKTSIITHHLESLPNVKLYDEKSLFESVAMSKKEFDVLIESMKVYHFDNHLRLLNADYTCELIKKILDCCIELDVDIFDFNADKVVECLCDLYPTDLIIGTLNYFFNETESKNCKANSKEICQIFATKFLEKVVGIAYKAISLDQLVVLVKKELPHEIEWNTRYLEGVAIANSPEVIWSESLSNPILIYINRFQLADDAEMRLSQLFDMKLMWQSEELRPFILDVIPWNNTLSEFIVNNTKTFTKNALKLYSRR